MGSLYRGGNGAIECRRSGVLAIIKDLVRILVIVEGGSGLSWVAHSLNISIISASHSWKFSNSFTCPPSTSPTPKVSARFRFPAIFNCIISSREQNDNSVVARIGIRSHGNSSEPMF